MRDMSNDKYIGAGILKGSVAGISAYFWLVFISTWSWLTVRLSAFATIVMMLLIIARACARYLTVMDLNRPTGWGIP